VREYSIRLDEYIWRWNRLQSILLFLLEPLLLLLLLLSKILRRWWDNLGFIYQVTKLNLLSGRWKLSGKGCFQESSIFYISDTVKHHALAHCINLHKYFILSPILVILECPFVNLFQNFKISFDPWVLRFENTRFLTFFKDPANECYHIFQFVGYEPIY